MINWSVDYAIHIHAVHTQTIGGPRATTAAALYAPGRSSFPLLVKAMTMQYEKDNSPQNRKKQTNKKRSRRIRRIRRR